MNSTTTENGEIAYSTTTDKNLDLFGTVNRDADDYTIAEKFVDAFNENNEMSLKILLNFRDIRNGKGEKHISRVLMFLLKVVKPEVYEKMLPIFLEMGYWKDLLYLSEMSKKYGLSYNFEVEKFTDQLTTDKNTEKISLCAKWAPSERSYFDDSTKFVNKLTKKMKMNKKEYRLLISSLRKKLNVLEKNMSEQTFDEINFSQIPSKAHLNHKDALNRQHNSEKVESYKRIKLQERYSKFLEDLENLKVKVNHKGIMPHELTTKVNGHDDVLVESQWKQIVDDAKKIGIFNNSLCIVDVSGSMSGQPMDVAIALGILVSECTEGPFKNKLLTFSSDPNLVDLSFSLSLFKKIEATKRMPWGMNTDIKKVFDLILQHSLKNNTVPPEKLFIFTDMQFDQVDSSYNVSTFEKFRKKYQEHGLKLPQIVCWNLRSVNSVPFLKDDKDVCLLSGFSTEILKAFLTGVELTPMNIMLEAIKIYNVPNFEKFIIGNKLSQKFYESVKKCQKLKINK